nr:flagellar basal body P-ring formation chaperone FlgA [uncultured Anaeromusa sp.]
MIEASEVAKAAVGEVYRQADVQPGDERVQVRVLSLPEGIEVPEGEVKLQVDLLYGLRYNAPTVARVVAMQDTQKVGQAILRLDVRRYQEVVVAARMLPGKSLLQPGDLKQLHLETGRLPDGFLVDPAKAIGQQLQRSLRSGDVLMDSMLLQPVIMRRGTAVTIQVRQGEMIVSASGEALQDGGIGQRIRVKNLVSKRIVTAKVIDEATVEVVVSRR